MRNLILAFFALSLLSASVSFAGDTDKGGETGSGGALIKRNGHVITVGTAGVRLRLRPLNADQIGGLSTLTNAIKKSGLPEHLVTELIVAMAPHLNRRYFAVEEASLPQEKLKALREMYAEKLGLPVDEVTLGGLTYGNETYLLPDFDKLKTDTEKAAVLYHESAWVLNPQLTYDEVLSLEADMQRYLEKGLTGYDRDLYDGFRKLIGVNKMDLAGVKAALEFDEKLGSKMTMADLLGEKPGFPRLSLEDAFNSFYYLEKNKDFQTAFRARLNALAVQRPQAQTPYELGIVAPRVSFNMTMEAMVYLFLYDNSAVRSPLYEHAFNARCFASLADLPILSTYFHQASNVLVRGGVTHGDHRGRFVVTAEQGLYARSSPSPYWWPAHRGIQNPEMYKYIRYASESCEASMFFHETE